MREVRNYWSPIDLVTLFAPLGAGMFSLWSDSDHVTNVPDRKPHLPHLIGTKARARILDDLRSGRPPPVREREGGALARNVCEELRTLR